MMMSYRTVCQCVSLLTLCVAVLPLTHTSSPWNVNCPRSCICDLRAPSYQKQQLRTVDCANRKLLVVPDDVPLNTQVLLLGRNGINSIHEQLPKLTELKDVDLSHNKIISLGEHPMFENLTTLQYLNLENNLLSTLLHGSFSGLKNLDHLKLGNNMIATIEDHAFGGMTHLKLLSLEHNKLNRVRSVWFDGISQLEILLLDNNQISQFEDGTYNALEKLEKLSLSGNLLQSLQKLSFRGLSQLQNLMLDKNRLTEVPSRALTVFRGLKILSMDGNPIKILNPYDFQDQIIHEISLCNMPDLRIIDRNAFTNMLELTILQIHDNSELRYLDASAFSRLPALQRLYIHNNKIMAIPYTMLQNMPIVQQVTLYHNPLHCDCNIHWLKETLVSKNKSRVTFPEADKLTCDTPRDLYGHLLRDVPLDHIPQICKPTVIPFFNDSYQKEIGETITYECRAIGVPSPHLHWILANGKILNNTSNFSRVRLGTLGTMSVLNVKATDAGTYTCVATNSQGYVTTSSRLQVHSKNIHILHKGVATNFITVTWNGTDSTVFTSDYLILYREDATDDEYKSIHLRPYMRTYTITHLKPETKYEFCIAYKHLDELVKLNCMDIKTKHQMYVMPGSKTLSKVTVVTALCATLAGIFFLCMSIALIKRYQRRKSYKEPEGTNTVVGNSNYKVGTMSQIPLDNLYNPPSTPICTSRTSLIGQVNA